MLIDIRTTFDTLGVDRIPSAELLDKLHELEDGMWLEWRGPNEDQHPHKLTANELYRVPEIVTRGRFPDGGESDSTWRTQEARHVGSDTIAPGF